MVTYKLTVLYLLFQDTLFNIRTAGGEIIQGKINVTGAEEGIIFTDGETKFIYDYETVRTLQWDMCERSPLKNIYICESIRFTWLKVGGNGKV